MELICRTATLMHIGSCSFKSWVRDHHHVARSRGRLAVMLDLNGDDLALRRLLHVLIIGGVKVRLEVLGFVDAVLFVLLLVNLLEFAASLSAGLLPRNC